MTTSISKIIGIALTIFAGFVALPQTASALGVRGPDDTLPSIVLDEVPLADAIKNLARQAQLNYIIDPRVTAAIARSGGSGAIRKTWKNVTASQALESLVLDQKLVMVTNPVTTVIRIAPANANVKPVPVSAVSSDTNQAMPLIVMDDVPLRDGIQALAQQAMVKIKMDPGLTTIAGPIGTTTVNLRWQNIKGKQALVALLDNYDLVVVPDPNSGIAKIVAKEPAEKAK